MGQVYADFTLVNLFNQRSVQIRALVDTGATPVFVTEDIARQLGFDVEEVTRQPVTLADGTRREIPRLGGLEICFADRKCHTDVFVITGECLVGVVPLELMDLVIEPNGPRVSFNPAHPDGPCLRA